MTDPMTRIADALDLIALAESYDVESPAMGRLRQRIAARHSVGAAFTDTPLVLSEEQAARYRAWLAQQTPVAAEAGCPASAESALRDRVAPSGGDSGRSHEPQTADVLGSELRMGDVVVAIRHARSTAMCTAGCPANVHHVTRDDVFFEDGDTASPDCMYRVLLPRPEPATPAESGEEIAQADRTLLSVGDAHWSLSTCVDRGVAEAYAMAIAQAVNAATRALRERCERAERVVEAAREYVRTNTPQSELPATFRPVALRRVKDALDEYDAARKDGAK